MERDGAPRNARIALAIATAAATASAASLLLPWVHSGSRARNGLESVRAAHTLGLSHPLLTATLVVPALAGFSWIAAAGSRPVAQALAAFGACGVMLAGAVVVHTSSLRPGGGTLVAIAAGSVCAIAATAALWMHRPARHRGDPR